MSEHAILQELLKFGQIGMSGALALWALVFLLKEIRFWVRGKAMPDAIAGRLDKIEGDLRELFQTVREQALTLGEVKGAVEVLVGRKK